MFNNALTLQGSRETGTLMYYPWVYKLVQFLGLEISIDIWKYLKQNTS